MDEYVEVLEGVLDGTSLPQPATCDGNNHSVTVTVDGLFVPGNAEGIAVLQDSTFTSVEGAAVADQEFAIR